MKTLTGFLLAARLAVPVVAAALDVPGSVAAAVSQLKSAGSQRPALAPLVIGPEADPELSAAAAEETGCPGAAPLGPHPAVAQLITSGYLAVLPPAVAATLRPRHPRTSRTGVKAPVDPRSSGNRK
ncbi:hypothetical protein ACFWP2_09205 [Kitasatospora sp. NPDC058444]|uniref:hypothetical protein n=1 Tax=Kitasatospora sp. NPDC058444 TaxID=3346504 RepID=UPI00365D6A0C